MTGRAFKRILYRMSKRTPIVTAGRLNREAWLQNAAGIFERRLFKGVEGVSFQGLKYRVSVGFPFGGRGGKGGKTHTIGQCWFPESSKDGTHEMFISPEVADPIAAAATLVHEMLHVAKGLKEGHGAGFRRAALAVGLSGKMTATIAGPELAAKLADLTRELGKFPHAELMPWTLKDGKKKQGTRMRKVFCPACGWTCRATAKWIEAGLPTCQCGEAMEAEPAPDDDGEGDDDGE